MKKEIEWIIFFDRVEWTIWVWTNDYQVSADHVSGVPRWTNIRLLKDASLARYQREPSLLVNLQE